MKVYKGGTFLQLHLMRSTKMKCSQTCLIWSWRDHQKNWIIQEFKLRKLCSKYIIVKGPIKKLRIIHKFELDKFDCISKRDVQTVDLLCYLQNTNAFWLQIFPFDSNTLLFITLIFTSVIKQISFRYSFARLHDITSQKSITVIFIAARRTNPIPTICNP